MTERPLQFDPNDPELNTRPTEEIGLRHLSSGTHPELPATEPAYKSSQSLLPDSSYSPLSETDHQSQLSPEQRRINEEGRAKMREAWRKALEK